jgi:transcriptional regulator with XRE-family HTH domain
MGYVKSDNRFDSITTYGWALGRELRKALMAADFSQQNMAARLGCSETRLSRIVTGRVDVTSEEVAALLALCGVVGERRDFLVRMARERSITAWGKREQQAVLRSLRWDAESVVEYAAVALPELLWTDAYAEAVISRMIGVQDDEIAGLVGTVNNDNAMLNRSQAPDYEVILSEAALHLTVGSKQIMCEQLYQLLRHSMRPGITIRVVPLSVGAHAGLRGAFCVVTRPDLVVAAIEEVLSIRFVDNAEDVQVYAAIMDKLRAVALKPAESRDLISTIVDEYHEDAESDEVISVDPVGEARAWPQIEPAGYRAGGGGR